MNSYSPRTQSPNAEQIFWFGDVVFAIELPNQKLCSALGLGVRSQEELIAG